MNQNHDYSVKNIRTFRGMEGDGYNASLYKGSKRIALVIDDATGGQTRFEWVSPEYEAELDTFVKTLPPVPVGNDTIEMSADIFVEELVNDALLLKKKKQWCKKKTVFRLKGDPEGQYRILNRPFDAKAKEYIEREYPDQIEELVNETLAQTDN